MTVVKITRQTMRCGYGLCKFPLTSPQEAVPLDPTRGQQVAAKLAAAFDVRTSAPPRDRDPGERGGGVQPRWLAALEESGAA